ncbi:MULTISPECIES: hypothetical protein [Peptoniphilus]|uniref:hypothetical protein n=1 Tax=Peptoniphilus TaxID=162289 RepID=UPI0001DA9A26|nr:MULTISPECIES: hypothetical protein [Peptoniphilus]EFI41856.1 hypothetical protein HMPREF0629_00485 [Peptoniphilus sp. oral taxon 386 str. F0131]
MKKIYLLILILILISFEVSAKEIDVNLEYQLVKINDTVKNIPAYKVEGYSYYRIRDIASALNKTNKRFDVSYDVQKNKIDLIRGREYQENLLLIYSKVEKTNLITTKLYIDGRPIIFSSININGYNYFRIRDLASVLDFNVEYDNIKKMIVINTATGYKSLGNDYLKAPQYTDLKTDKEFYSSISKSYADLYEVQKSVMEDLKFNGTNYSKLVSLKNSLFSFENYYNSILDSSYLKGNEKIKRMYEEFLDSFKLQNRDYYLLVTSIESTDKNSELDSIKIYENSFNKVKENFVKLTNELSQK